MTLKVGINGFGRIGRNIYRAADDMKADFEIVAVNDIGDAATFAHLLKHDTALGTFGPAVSVSGDSIKGKVEFERNGESQSRDWEAKREGEKK